MVYLAELDPECLDMLLSGYLVRVDGEARLLLGYICHLLCQEVGQQIDLEVRQRPVLDQEVLQSHGPRLGQCVSPMENQGSHVPHEGMGQGMGLEHRSDLSDLLPQDRRLLENAQDLRPMELQLNVDLLHWLPESQMEQVVAVLNLVLEIELG